MTRNRLSAKKGGTGLERAVADYLAEHVDDRIDRRVKTGGKDKGDIGGLRHMGQRLVIECKAVAKMDLPGWTREAEMERGNDDAVAGLVVHKRIGVSERTRPADQWVTMTLGELVALLTGNRDHIDKDTTP